MTDRLYQPSAIKDILSRYQFTIKKSFGQNFLTDAHVLQDIIELASGELNDVRACGILEIGPGMGTLTSALAQAGFGQILAVEKDRQLLPILSETVGSYANVQVIQADGLELTKDVVMEHLSGYSHIRLIANLPYYITTPLLMSMLESDIPFDRLVVMVQREVAERIVAPPGGKIYGALSVAVQYYTQPSIARIVTPGCFMPPPNVESAIVVLDVHDAPLFPELNRQMYFKIVRGAFAKRRKTLANSIAQEFSELTKTDVLRWLIDAGIDEKRRGETLSLNEFAKLCAAYPSGSGGREM